MGKMATAFKDIGKACSDLLSKDYNVNESTVEVKTKTPTGVTFTPSATRETKKGEEKFKGSLAAKYLFMAGLEGEVTLNTSGIVAASLECADLATKGLTAKLDCETPATGSNGLLSVGKATVDYKQEKLNIKTSYDYYKGGLAVAASSVFQSLAFGCSADYNTAKSKLAKYGAACQFVQPEFTVCAKLAESVGGSDGVVYSCSYFHKVSSDMVLGGELSKKTNKAEIDITFGCAFQLDKATTVKGKVDADGILCASYKQKISPITTMTLAAEIDTVNLSDNKHKYGLVLNVTP